MGVDHEEIQVRLLTLEQERVNHEPRYTSVVIDGVLVQTEIPRTADAEIVSQEQPKESITSGLYRKAQDVLKTLRQYGEK